MAKNPGPRAHGQGHEHDLRRAGGHRKSIAKESKAVPTLKWGFPH
jgi:hypothetical protein